MQRFAGITTDPEPAPPTRDVEPGFKRSFDNHSRVSLPSHRRSVSTLRSRTPSRAALGLPPRDDPSSYPPADPTDPPPSDDAASDASDDPNEIPWGPAHPCFPHRNPHVPTTSAAYAATRVIRIKRDWMAAGDLAPAFSQLYPEILDPVLPEDTFRALVSHINAALRRAFDPWRPRSWLDATLAFLTGWAWDDVGAAAVKGEVAALEAWVEKWNREVGKAGGVRVVPLRRTAFLCLDLEIPDPRLGGEGEEEEAGEEEEGQTTAQGTTEAGTEIGLAKSTWSWRSGSVGRSSRPSSMMSGRTSAWSFRGGRQREAREEAATPVPPIPRQYLGQAAGRKDKGRG